MMISDEEAAELKTWVVKKLEDISDADSDVLADYVLALLRADTPEPELRLNAIENLEDFLKDNTASFVDAIFLAIRNRSYMPGYAPPQSAGLPTTSFSAPTGPAVASYSQTDDRIGPKGGFPQSRKRSYNDRTENGAGGDPHYGRDDRQMKQIRRGGGRGGRSEGFNARGGRGGFLPSGSLPALPPLGFPGIPSAPPSLPFDPNDPVAAMLAIQAMGFPALAGMPPLPSVGSPIGYPQPGGQRSPVLDTPMKNKINARCRDYDTKGFCTRGNACPFEHGNDHMVVPDQDEYDPKNSVMMDIQKTPTSANGNKSFEALRGNESGRGQPRGRGDRGSFAPQRRNRADFSHIGPNHDRSITTIVVEQIPEDKFEQQPVRDFFSTFGNVTDVTMQAYKRLALVKFEDYNAAKRAYESPKVIFDNRFVKVYWYKPDSLPTAPTNGIAKVKSSTTASAEEQTYDKEKYERDVIAAQKKSEEKKALLRDTETKREALEKQKEELDRKQAEEKKKLMEKLAAKGKPGAMSSNISTQATDIKTNGTNGKASAQTEALRAQVAALEAEAKSLGLDTALTDDPWTARGRGRGRGRGSYRGWEGFAGRGASYESPRGAFRVRGAFVRGARGGGAYHLDNRTKKVAVSGVEFDGEKDEGLRQYLLGVGEFEAIEAHPDHSGSQIVTFKDRFTAEKFIHSSKDIPSVGKVDFAWVNTPLPPVSGLGSTKQSGANGDGDTGMGDANGDGDNSMKHAVEVDYDVAEDDDRWMVE